MRELVSKMYGGCMFARSEARAGLEWAIGLGSASNWAV